MPGKAFQFTNANDGGAESSPWLLATQLSVGKSITTLLEAKFLLTRARLSLYFQRLDALRWTPYLDECMAVLAEKDDQANDTLLIYSVKLQLIVENMGQGSWHEQHDSVTGSSRVPPIFYLKALQTQLQDLKAKIPAKIQRNGMRIY